jgi:hypothetical protein
MKIDEENKNHFEKLIRIGDNLVKKRRPIYLNHLDSSGKMILMLSHQTVNYQNSSRWASSCLYFLKHVFSEKSDHYSRFKNISLKFELDKNFRSVNLALGILKSAKDDYENKHLFDTQIRIEASVFSNFIEQSEYLLSQGYFQASAVIAGCVLEDALRKLCVKNNITFPKKPTIEPMNAELAKNGIYNQFIKDKVSSIGKLRNHAAHGEWTEFAQKDVEDMIRNVRRFMEDYFS